MSKYYQIQVLNILDKRTSESFYIREILDSCCYEYNYSKLNNQRRLEIIADLGIDELFRLLDDCYKCRRSNSYNALHETEFTLYRLSMESPDLFKSYYSIIQLMDFYNNHKPCLQGILDLILAKYGFRTVEHDSP